VPGLAGLDALRVDAPDNCDSPDVHGSSTSARNKAAFDPSTMGDDLRSGSPHNAAADPTRGGARSSTSSVSGEPSRTAAAATGRSPNPSKLYPDNKDLVEIGNNFLVATKTALTSENTHLINKNKSLEEEVQRLRAALQASTTPSFSSAAKATYPDNDENAFAEGSGDSLVDRGRRARKDGEVQCSASRSASKDGDRLSVEMQQGETASSRRSFSAQEPRRDDEGVSSSRKEKRTGSKGKLQGGGAAAPSGASGRVKKGTGKKERRSSWKPVASTDASVSGEGNEEKDKRSSQITVRLPGEVEERETKSKIPPTVPGDLETMQEQLLAAQKTIKQLQSEYDFIVEKFSIHKESTGATIAALEADRDNLLIELSSMHQVEIIPLTISVATQIEADLCGPTFTLFEVVSERGVAYRRSYGNLKDRVIDMLGPTYGESVAAQEVRGDWIYTIDGFWLPTIVDGLVALVPARNNGNLDQNLGDKLHSIWSRWNERTFGTNICIPNTGSGS